MSNDTQPEIRFPGFTDDWEQRKLKEFGKSTGGTSIESEFVEGGKYKVISIGSYSEQSVYTDQNIRAELTDKTRNRVLNKGDLTMILNDKTASGNIIGRVLLIDSNDSYVYNQRTERIEPDHKKYDSQFLYHMLNAPMIRSKIIKQAQGNTQIYVNWSAIGELDYLVPNLDEQREIGAFFFNLNNLITLHQRKLDLLKETKKGFLQKMFPKNGAKAPEIRFPGFTKDWEERTLGDVFSERSERSSEGELISVTINSGVIKASELDRKDNSSDNKSNYKKVEVGDIAYNSMRMWQGASGYSSYEGILSPAYTVIIPKEGTDSKFFAYDFKRYDMIQTFKRNSQGLTSDTWNLKFPTLKLVKIMVPSIEEQKQIAAFFERLDNTIALHERELDVLKETKKGFLQKMFV
ncbi:restriction endonuclease subunit S [Enterococcus hirae]|nr:restriction endonuclease subunit S [Enterococcus hirae]EMF0298777.1 restriction endonuclease subunit S [Enterococcus hirae]